MSTPPVMPIAFAATLALGNEYTTELLGWLAVIVLGAAIIGAIGYKMFKRAQADVEIDDVAPVFTLNELRQLHRQGHLTDEEFAIAKAKVLAAYQDDAEPAAVDDGGIQFEPVDEDAAPPGDTDGDADSSADPEGGDKPDGE